MGKPVPGSRRFDGVLFDMDGTLLDTLADIAVAINSVLAAEGLPELSLPLCRRLLGEGTQALVTRALAFTGAAPRPVADLIDRYRSRYSRCWHDHSAPYPEIRELLHRLAAARMSLAVLSNKADDFAREMAEALLPDGDLTVVRGELPGVPRKPDPTAALELARLLEIPPARLAFVGDSGIDVSTGRAAGMTPLGVLWGYRDREELESAGAEALFATPAALGDYLLGAGGDPSPEVIHGPL